MVFDKSSKIWNCDLLQNYKMQEQLSHVMEDFAELEERMSLVEGQIIEHGKKFRNID